MISYIAGLLTIPALVVVVLAVQAVLHYFTNKNRSHGCAYCDLTWNQDFTMKSWKAYWARELHSATNHKGLAGRDCIAYIRGLSIYERRRLNRTFPNPEVGPLDVICRIPFFSGAAWWVAERLTVRRGFSAYPMDRQRTS